MGARSERTLIDHERVRQAPDAAAPVSEDARVPGLWSPQLRGITAGLVFTITLVAFEALAIITILPLVSADLGGLGLYGWVISAFSLGLLVGIVAGGDQADRRGPAAPFVVGLLLFATGLAIGGLAPTMPVLVAARAIQGAGAGTIPSVAYASIGRTYPDAQRPRVFAVLSTAWVVPGLVGPSVAAIVGVHLGWRWVFLGLLPLVALAGLLTVRPLRRLGRPPVTATRPGRFIDALRLALGAGALLAALSSRSPVIGPLLAVAGLVVGLRPLLRLLPAGTLQARRGLPAAVLARGMLTFAFFGADTFVPLALTSARGQSTTVAGAAVTAATLSWTAGAWFQERRASSWSNRRLVTMGFGILLAGIAVVALVLVPAVPIAVALVGWLIGGLGIGVAYAQISVAVLGGAPPGQEGSSSAAMQLSDTLGVALGAGIGGVAIAAAAAAGLRAQVGLAVAFALAAAVAALGIVTARRLTPTLGRGVGAALRRGRPS